MCPANNELNLGDTIKDNQKIVEVLLKLLQDEQEKNKKLTDLLALIKKDENT
jgi:hypothetical protein